MVFASGVVATWVVVEVVLRDLPATSPTHQRGFSCKPRA